MPISADQIHQHVKLSQHIKFLNRALGYMPNLVPLRPPLEANNLRTNPALETNVPRPNVGANIKPIGTNAPISKFAANISPIRANAPRLNVGANVPPTGANAPNNILPIGMMNYQIRMTSNLTQYAPISSSPSPSPSLSSNSDISAKREKFEHVTDKLIENKNDIKIIDTHITVNDTEMNENCSNKNDDAEEVEDDEEEHECDNNLNELNKTLDSMSSEDALFDIEEFVYLKLRNTYTKVSNAAYNTLVHVGDGTRYCFVCASQIEHYKLQKHVDSRQHMENLEKYRFLTQYESHLLRQVRIFVANF